jgi:hypothetical protein
MRGLPIDWLQERLDLLGNRRLGEILVDQGIINKSQLNCVLGMQQETGKRLGELLVDMSLASPEQIEWAIEQQDINSPQTGKS